MSDPTEHPVQTEKATKTAAGPSRWVDRFDHRLIALHGAFSGDDEARSHDLDDHYRVELWHAFLMGASHPDHVFALAVVEPAPQNKGSQTQDFEFLTAKPISVKGSSGLSLGLVRLSLSVDEFRRSLATLEKTGVFEAAESITSTPPLSFFEERFSQVDGTERNELNALLKSNIYSGGYVQEYTASPTPPLSDFTDGGRISAELDEALLQLPEFPLATLPDRLGNLLIQFRIEPLSCSVSRSPTDGITVAAAWHPDVPPRAVRVVTRFDDQFGPVQDIEALAQWSANVPAPPNYERCVIEVQDAALDLKYFAMSPLGFFMGGHLQMSTSGTQHRTVKIQDPDGNTETKTVQTISHDRPTAFGVPRHPQKFREAERVRAMGAKSLQGSLRLVSYGRGPKPGNDRARALADVERLLLENGRQGAWLWDPFLDGNDILQTLALCPHKGSDLRAISGGKSVCRSSNASPSWVRAENAVLKSGLGTSGATIDLRVRVRMGQSGWAFHDRFLIFPQGLNAYAVWSLGTSVNSLGKSHHIIVKVPNGDQIASEFIALWDALEADPQCHVWPSP